MQKQIFMHNLTLVIPAKHEAESINRVLNELRPYNIETIISLEKNDLETIKEIQKCDYNANIIYQNGKGYGNALIQGIQSVKTKYFCIFNADGSFDPAELQGMLSDLLKNDLDIIFGSRYQKNSGSDDDTFLTFIGNKFFTFLGKFLFKLPLTDILYTYVMGNADKVSSLNLSNQDFTLCVELPIKAKLNNLKIGNFSSKERSRFAGKKKVNEFKDGFLILIEILSLFFNVKK